MITSSPSLSSPYQLRSSSPLNSTKLLHISCDDRTQPVQYYTLTLHYGGDDRATSSTNHQSLLNINSGKQASLSPPKRYQWTISKRYRDFYALRSLISIRYPFYSLPSIPPKHYKLFKFPSVFCSQKSSSSSSSSRGYTTSPALSLSSSSILSKSPSLSSAPSPFLFGSNGIGNDQQQQQSKIDFSSNYSLDGSSTVGTDEPDSLDAIIEERIIGFTTFIKWCLDNPIVSRSREIDEFLEISKNINNPMNCISTRAQPTPSEEEILQALKVSSPTRGILKPSRSSSVSSTTSNFNNSINNNNNNVITDSFAAEESISYPSVLGIDLDDDQPILSTSGLSLSLSAQEINNSTSTLDVSQSTSNANVPLNGKMRRMSSSKRTSFVGVPDSASLSADKPKQSDPFLQQQDQQQPVLQQQEEKELQQEMELKNEMKQMVDELKEIHTAKVEPAANIKSESPLPSKLERTDEDYSRIFVLFISLLTILIFHLLFFKEPNEEKPNSSIAESITTPVVAKDASQTIYTTESSQNVAIAEESAKEVAVEAQPIVNESEKIACSQVNDTVISESKEEKETTEDAKSNSEIPELKEEANIDPQHISDEATKDVEDVKEFENIQVNSETVNEQPVVDEKKIAETEPEKNENDESNNTSATESADQMQETKKQREETDNEIQNDTLIQSDIIEKEADLQSTNAQSNINDNASASSEIESVKEKQEVDTPSNEELSNTLQNAEESIEKEDTAGKSLYAIFFEVLGTLGFGFIVYYALFAAPVSKPPIRKSKMDDEVEESVKEKEEYEGSVPTTSSPTADMAEKSAVSLPNVVRFADASVFIRRQLPSIKNINVPQHIINRLNSLIDSGLNPSSSLSNSSASQSRLELVKLLDEHIPQWETLSAENPIAEEKLVPNQTDIKHEQRIDMSSSNLQVLSTQDQPSSSHSSQPSQDQKLQTRKLENEEGYSRTVMTITAIAVISIIYLRPSIVQRAMNVASGRS